MMLWGAGSPRYAAGGQAEADPAERPTTPMKSTAGGFAAEGAPERRKMAVMSATERRLMSCIIEEREKRVQAVSELAARLDGFQSDLKRRPAELALAPPPQPLEQSPPPAALADRHLDEFQHELATLRRELGSQRASADTSLEALRATMRQAEASAQEGLRKAEQDVDSLGLFVNEELTKLRGRMAKLADKGPEKTNSLPTARFFGSGGGEATKHIQENVAELKSRMTSLEERLAELQLQVPLLAIRSSRIALHSHELMREERRLALSSLEAKEAQVRTEISKIRESNENQTLVLTAMQVQALNELTEQV